MTSTAVQPIPFADSPAIAGNAISTRDLAFDCARLIASVGIVWCHSPRSETLAPFQPLGAFGTCFFASASIYFMIRSMRARPDRAYGDYARSRFVRLYLPFLAWSVIYLAFREATRLFVTHDPLVAVSPMTLLSGGETHLWFLSFILIACVASFPLAKFALASPRRARNIAVGCLIVGVLLVLNGSQAFEPEVDTVNFYRVAWFALPSVFLGLGLGLWDDLIDRLRAHAALATPLALIVASVCVGFAVRDGVEVWSKNIAGTGWLIVALTLPRARRQGWIARLAPLGFGLYLTHPLILGGLRAFHRSVGLDASVGIDLTKFALAVVGGLLIAWTLQRSRFTRWLVP